MRLFIFYTSFNPNNYFLFTHQKYTCPIIKGQQQKCYARKFLVSKRSSLAHIFDVFGDLEIIRFNVILFKIHDCSVHTHILLAIISLL